MVSLRAADTLEMLEGISANQGSELDLDIPPLRCTCIGRKECAGCRAWRLRWQQPKVCEPVPSVTIHKYTSISQETWEQRYSAKYPAARCAEICAAYEAGESAYSMARRLKIPKTTLKSILVRGGIQMRGHGRTR